MSRPRLMPPFHYIRKGDGHWAGYLARYRDQHTEMLNTFRGPLKKPERVRLTRKNRQSASAHEKISRWLLAHHDARTAWVGRWDERDRKLYEMKFGALARGMGVHPETLKRELRKYRANGLIHRWQGRDHRPENKDQPWAGKVAVLRLTRRFFEVSRCAEARNRLLERWRKQEEKAQRRLAAAEAPPADPAAEVARLAAAAGVNVHQMIHFVRRARVQLGPDATTFAVHRHADGLLASCQQRRPPPTRRPPGEATPGGAN